MQAAMNRADRRLLTIAGVVVALLLAAALAFSPGPGGEASLVPSTYSATSSGARAAYLLLADLGYQEQRWERPPAGLEDVANGPLLILAEPTETPTQPEKAALWRFVSQGGRVLFCGPEIGSFFPEHPVKAEGPGQEWMEVTPSLPSALSRGVRKVVLDPEAYWGKPDTSQLRLYGGEDSAAIVDWRIGKGDLVWWMSATPLTNAGITQADNLNLFLNSVGGAEEEKPAVYWDEYYHGQRTGLWGYFEKTPLPWSLLQFGLAAVAVLLTFSRRSGPVIPAPQVSRLSPLEFVETMGGLYERAGAASVAVAVPYRRFRLELARMLGCSANTADAELAQAAGERLGFDAAQLAKTLESAAGASEETKLKDKVALELVRDLERYSQNLRSPGALIQEKR